MNLSRITSKKSFASLGFSAVLSLFFLFPLQASEPVEAKKHVEEHTSSEHKKFNAGEMILEHISDSHEWHLYDYTNAEGKEIPVSVPLPILIYNSGKIESFMSSKFNHGHDTVTTANGNSYYMDSKHHIQSKEGESFFDFSITKNVLALFTSAILILIIFISVANSYTKTRLGKAPKGIQSVVEPFIIFIRDEVAKPSIGRNYNKYMPYLLSVFFFIWLNNLLGLIPIIPFGANLSGNIAFTMTLALFTFAITTFSANKDYWIHIFNTPGVPWWLKFPIPLMPVVEFLGVFIKPFVLTLRLFANMTAGHIIPLAFISLIFIFGSMGAAAGFGVSIMSVFLSLFMKVLELLVCFLQAYVFTLLSAMYFGMAVEEHHHEHDEEHIIVDEPSLYEAKH